MISYQPRSQKPSQKGIPLIVLTIARQRRMHEASEMKNISNLFVTFRFWSEDMGVGGKGYRRAKYDMIIYLRIQRQAPLCRWETPSARVGPMYYKTSTAEVNNKSH